MPDGLQSKQSLAQCGQNTGEAGACALRVLEDPQRLMGCCVPAAVGVLGEALAAKRARAKRGIVAHAIG